MKENSMVKRYGKRMLVFLCALWIGVLGSLGLNLYILDLLQSSIEDENTQENGVTIAEEYTIESTEQISDAYKSGNSSALSDTDKETLNMASDVLGEIIKDGMTDYEKEKAVYEWITENISTDDGAMTVVPTTQDNGDNPHGVLKNHKAVCVGYATTFRLFMQMMDIPCMVVHNSEKYHSWDLVQLDGDWYHVDCYSDANISGTPGYASFNRTDEMMSNNGQEWDTDYFPAATSLELNMAYQNRTGIDDIYDIPKYVRKALDDGQSVLGLQFDGALSDVDQTRAENVIAAVENAVYSTEDYANVTIDYTLASDDDGTLIMVSMTDYVSNDDDDETINDDIRNKINKAIEKSFGDIMTEDEDDLEIGGAVG